MAIPLSPGTIPHQVPRSTLTHPSTGVSNGGYDNENNDLILWTGFVLQPETAESRYIVSDMLGQGTFGQVAKCLCQQTGEVVAVKVIKNQTAFYHQARVEVGVLQYLNKVSDPDDQHHLVRMHAFFVFKDHLCLVFELLSLNLYELIKQNQFRGLSMRLLRIFLAQILDALCVLRNSQIVHCDLKPENVLLQGEAGQIKLIDFGSACFENRTMYSYIQSRFYRSPEVLLGHPYDMAIDMWSLGCMAAELFLGLPLFPGASEHDLLVRIVDMLGMPPHHVLLKAQHTNRYFRRVEMSPSPVLPSSARSSSSRPTSAHVLRSQAEFEALFSCKAPAGKRYFQHTKLADIIGAYPVPPGLDDQQALEERQQREVLLDFLLGILDLDPDSRWTPSQALQHPFITQAPFTGPFQPRPDSPHPARSLRDYASPTAGSSSQTAAAYVYGAASQPPLTPLATSPELHAQAHLAALAAVANLSPHSAFAAPGHISAYQAALQQMGSAAASSSVQQQQQMGAQPTWAANRLQSSAADSLNSSMAFSHAQQLPFTSFQAALLQQQPTQQYSSFGSFSQSPMALPLGMRSGPSLMPMGSLEALRGGWHAPRGRNAYGDMYGSSFTVPSRQASLAGSLGTGSLGPGSIGPPRLPPSLNSYRRGSFSTSPAGPYGVVPNSQNMAAASPSMSAAAPNRIFGFGAAAAFPDLVQQTPAQQQLQQQQQLSRQHSLHSKQLPSPRNQAQHAQAESGLPDQPEDWSDQLQGPDEGQLGVPTRQTSLDIPTPGDWDPNFSEDQLLEEGSIAQATPATAPNLQFPWSTQDRVRQRSANHLQSNAQQLTPLASIPAQGSPIAGLSAYSTSDAQQALQTSSMQEQLTHQLPGSFASMSTSFASPQAVQAAQQMPLGPHDPAWFRDTHTSQAQTSQAQLTAAQSALSLQHQQLQHQAGAAHNDLLQQDLFSDGYGGLCMQQQQHQQQHCSAGACESLPAQLQQQHQMSGAYDALLLQQQLHTPDVLTHQALHQQPGLSQQQSLLLLAAQQQLLNDQLQASQLHRNQQQQQQQQLLLAAAAMPSLGDTTSRPLPDVLLQQHHRSNGASTHGSQQTLLHW